ncbi:MAG TPA: 6-phosphogluconolactonase [Rubricoccaceae bacterium]|nr:6-phosphogluconolactonase [Rubricoccaceae bacterium]
MPEVHVFPTPDALAEAAAARIESALRDALAARGRASLVLTGGSAPGPVYRRLAARPDALDWARVHVFWGDERCVPPGDDESNYRLAREAMLDALPIPDAQVHRMACEASPDEAAEAYADALRAFFDGHEALFDVTLLGLGEDGHVASLFPGDDAVDEPNGWVMATEAPPSSPVAQRLTLTLPALNAARLVLFLVTGEKKQAALRRVLDAADAGDPPPAARVRPVGNLAWYVDEAAYRQRQG